MCSVVLVDGHMGGWVGVRTLWLKKAGPAALRGMRKWPRSGHVNVCINAMYKLHRTQLQTQTKPPTSRRDCLVGCPGQVQRTKGSAGDDLPPTRPRKKACEYLL